MQVQLRQQRAHLAALAREQRQHLALEAFLQVPRSRALQLDRAAGQRQPARLAAAVAIARRDVDPRATLRLAAAQERRQLFLQHRLHRRLDLRAHELLERLPRRH